jgi:hypothetical protein
MNKTNINPRQDTTRQGNTKQGNDKTREDKDRWFFVLFLLAETRKR